MFRSYLSNRVQSVRINETISDGHFITVGIPQGSVLGPTLFIVFVNDLNGFLRHDSISLTSYADDTNILVCTPTFQESIDLTVETLHKFQYWMSKNKLSINKDKTVVVNFGLNKRHGHQENLSTDTLSVPFLSSAKMLGLTLDSGLKWTDHIDMLCGRLARCCYAIKTVKQYATPATVRALYFACFQSHLKFGVVHWGIATEWLRVFRIQKRAIRIIAGLGYRDSCRNSFIHLRILTLPSLYVFEICCLVYKNHDLFNKNCIDHQHDTRFKGHLKPDIHSTGFYQKSLVYNACKCFNQLPDYIKNSVSFKIFQRRLRSLLASKAYYNYQDFLNDDLEDV